MGGKILVGVSLFVTPVARGTTDVGDIILDEIVLRGSLYPGMKFIVGDSPFSVAVTDLNGDGRPDLVTANSGSSDVSVLLHR